LIVTTSSTLDGHSFRDKVQDSTSNDDYDGDDGEHDGVESICHLDERKARWKSLNRTQATHDPPPNMPPPVGTLSSTRYTIIVDAGSSGSRLIIYSYQDPEAERNEIVDSIRAKYGRNSRSDGKYHKGKSQAALDQEIEGEVEKSLRRLVKVEKGATGDDWMKRAEPGQPTILDRALFRVLTESTGA
jgi:hypothetical protein